MRDDENLAASTQQTLGIEETTPVTSNPGASDHDDDTVDEAVDDDHKPGQTRGGETHNFMKICDNLVNLLPQSLSCQMSTARCMHEYNGNSF